jgi:hypothetical protein
VIRRSSGLSLEEFAFAATLFDQSLRRSTSARALVEPVIFFVAARNDV